MLGCASAVVHGNCKRETDLVIMRLKVKTYGMLIAALLSGCGSLSNLPQLDLSEAGGSLTDWDSEETGSIEEGMPLPVRNSKRAGVKSAQVSQGDAAPLIALPDLSDVSAFASAPTEPSIITQWEQKPVGVYTVLARQIYTCWLNAATPKLHNHGLHAEVASGDAAKATIIIYQKSKDGRRGLQAFRIEIHGGLSGSRVEAKNRRLEKELDFSFREDVARWSHGDQSCGV